MTTFPRTPRVLHGGMVLLDPDTSTVLRVIPLQYNPETLTRSLQPLGLGGEGGDRLEALRLKGPPVETIKLDAELDAADQLEFPARNPSAIQFGLHLVLAALETMIYPASSALQANRERSSAGTLEIVPVEAPLTLFVWSEKRVLPVRLTEFNIVEELFDPNLNPIRAKVSLGMRVLTPNDLGYDHKGSSLFMAYHRQKEQMAQTYRSSDLGALGIRRIP